jgi:CBS domain-containing protein/uncharacterized protein (DUF2267 family)
MPALSSNLTEYDHERMVVLSPNASVYDAARALEANHVGCVVVADDHRIVGIVTDRDLALRVVGYDFDPRNLTLRDVMTAEVATVPAGATEADVARLMLEMHVRRVPIETGGKVVGLVTLDDLIIHGADPDLVACIVTAQLAGAAARKEAGAVHSAAPADERPDAAERSERRHRAHAEARYWALLRKVMAEAELETRERAQIALEVVLGGILERITPEAAADLVAQLPLLLRERLSSVARGPNRNVTRESIERVLAVQLDVSEGRASQLVRRLARAVESAVSAGELRDVKAQLPSELRALFA